MTGNKLGLPETGMDYFGARYYASSMGLFLSADWSLGPATVPYAHLDNPQTLNLYAYVDNNPINGIDADGHAFESIVAPSGSWGLDTLMTSGFEGTTEDSSKDDPLTELQALDAATGPQMATEQGTPHSYDSAHSEFTYGINDWIDRTNKKINSALAPVYSALDKIMPHSQPFCTNYGCTDSKIGIVFPTGGLDNIGGGVLTSEEALAAGEKWLGTGYKEIAPGVYRSADGLRQFRMTTSDLLDLRQGPHVHFESISPDGRTIIENSHVNITNP